MCVFLFVRVSFFNSKCSDETETFFCMWRDQIVLHASQLSSCSPEFAGLTVMKKVASLYPYESADGHSLKTEVSPHDTVHDLVVCVFEMVHFCAVLSNMTQPISVSFFCLTFFVSLAMCVCCAAGRSHSRADDSHVTGALRCCWRDHMQL